MKKRKILLLIIIITLFIVIFIILFFFSPPWALKLIGLSQGTKPRWKWFDLTEFPCRKTMIVFKNASWRRATKVKFKWQTSDPINATVSTQTDEVVTRKPPSCTCFDAMKGYCCALIRATAILFGGLSWYFLLNI